MKLTSKEAIEYVIKEYGYNSYYSIAAELSKTDTVKVQTIQISNYHKGRRVMGQKVAEHFLVVFGIEITDTYHSQGRPSEW
jgi:hypothetical protein